MHNYFDFWKLLAGLSLFLFAMRQMENALRQLSGKRFQQILSNSSKSPIRSVITGMLTTTIVQSSSLISLIVLAFVGIGILPLVNAIGIVIGSNLGTTFTGWIVATIGFKLDLSSIIYPVLGISGLGLGVLKNKWKSFGLFIFGLALLLLGLEFMKSSTTALTTKVDIGLLSGYPLIVYLVLGTVLSAVIQSSSAVMMLTLSAVFAGIIPLTEAAALIIGADLGTTSTVILGSLQGSVTKRQLAMAHVLFNFFVDVLAFVFLYPLLELIKILGISDPLFSLVAFHSLFNFFGLLVFLPFIKKFAQLLQLWIKKEQQHLSKYIHNVAEDITETAIEALTKETQYLLYLVTQLNLRFLQIYSAGSQLPKQLQNSSKVDYYVALKELEGEIINYSLKINFEGNSYSTTLASEQIDTLMKAIRAGIYSAKSLKDIDGNIQSFKLQDNKQLNEYFQNLQVASQSLYREIETILLNQHNNNINQEEIIILSENSHIFHHDFNQEIYNKMGNTQLSTLDLSSALNVNKEIGTSEKALLEALSLYSKANENRA